MKQIGTFGVGAVLAASIVFFVMKGRQPVIEVAAPPAAQTAVIPEVTPTVESQPETVPTHTAPERVPSRVPERRPVPARIPPSTSPASGQSSQTASTPPPQTAPAANVPPLTPSAPVAESRPPAEESRPVQPPPRPEPKTVTVPAGTLVSVRLDERLSTKTQQTGDSFRASLSQPLVVDGFVIAERGARVEGRVVESDPGGRVKGLSRLSLELTRLTTSDGQHVKLQTQSFAKEAKSENKKDVAKVGIAAGIGAAIGALAGGGKGAGIGAGVGGAAGAGGVMATRGAAAEFPPETRISFRLNEPVTLTERLR